MNISYSTVVFHDRGTEAALEAVAASDFSQVEILGQEPHLASPPTGRALVDFRARLESLGLRPSSLHAPLTRNVLRAPEEAWRKEIVEVLRSYLRLGGELGAGKVVIHPVPNPIFVPNADDPSVPGLIGEAVTRSLDDLMPTCQAAGVCITLENLPYDCEYPLLTMQDLRPLVDAYPESCLGLVIDTGHAWTNGQDPAREIRIAGARLRGTHLQDVDYDQPDDNHWLPTHGGLDWDAIRQALREVHYSGPWTFEVYSPRHGESPEELARLSRGLGELWTSNEG